MTFFLFFFKKFGLKFCTNVKNKMKREYFITFVLEKKVIRFAKEIENHVGTFPF
jgi:hypothetical protein